MPTRSANGKLVLIIAILLLAAFFRFYLIAEIPPGLYPDEAVNANNALEALRTSSFKIFYPENNGREGLLINLQAVAIQLFGQEPWVLRVVSAIVGTLTVLGIYLLTKELFGGYEILNGTNIRNRFRNFVNNSYFVALLTAFFLATSYWHINFSRIGFRAILVPFFATFGLYWLLRALRTGKISSTVLAGISTGLGFYTYIVFRFIPFVLAVPILLSSFQWRREKLFRRAASPVRNPREGERARSPTAVGGARPSGSAEILAGDFKRVENGTAARQTLPCTPCVIAIFLFVTFVTALPIGLHFLNNTGDFFGRGGQVSIFSAESPGLEFIKSTTLTLGMFNFQGDCNQRHNLNCAPQLFWPVGVLFLIGFVVALVRARAARIFVPRTGSGILKPIKEGGGDKNVGRERPQAQPELLLLAWFVFLMLPATLTREGLPHALRAIGLIPPVMIFAGLGGAWLWQVIVGSLNRARENPAYERHRAQISRIQKELAVAAILFLIWIPLNTYRDYFVRFAYAPETRGAFSADLWDQGRYLAALPDEITKFVIVNLAGDEIRGVPAPAQTIMFATDTFDLERRGQKRLTYVIRPENIAIDARTEAVIIPMNRRDETLLRVLQQQFPQLKAKVIGDIVIFRN